jgi:hypothetical protein
MPLIGLERSRSPIAGKPGGVKLLRLVGPVGVLASYILFLAAVMGGREYSVFSVIGVIKGRRFCASVAASR